MDEASDLRPSVAAVLVAHDGAAWLPKVLTSLAELTVAPVAWHAVDVASTDETADYLRASLGPSRLSFASSGTSFGDAVRLGLEQLPRTDWIWLLHDDVSVRPDTLAGLLAEATSADDIAVVGPKLREWPSLQRLLEVGLTITGTGARETGLETGEPDAGQHDRPRTVLAVNTAGMLVRRDVWDELGGLDPYLPLFFDDIDFGWRVSSAGHRVRTAPLGVMFHAEASRRGTRRRSAGDVPTWEYRRAALHTLLANTSRGRFPWQYVRLFAGSLLRFLGFVIGKDPEAASDELLALRAVYARPRRLRAARRARAPFVRRPRRDIAGLFPAWWLPYRHGLDAAREAMLAIVRPEAVRTTGRRSSAPEGDEDAFTDGPSLLRRRPWFGIVVGLVLLSLVAGRAVLGTDLHALALPPPPDTAGGWWALVLERRHDAGLPSTAFGPPFALLLAMVTTPVWFAPGLAVSVLLIGAVPLAALTAHRLGRRLSDERPVRIVWAITWGLLVVGTGAVAQGRIGTVVALIVVPVIVNVTLQVVEEPTWQRGLRLGLWIAVAAAFAPVVYTGVAAAMVLTVVLAGRQVVRALVVALVVPLVLLGPWIAQRVARPWRMWWEAGHPVPGSADVLDVVAGRGGGPGAAPLGLTAGIVVLGLLALLSHRARREVCVAWAVAVLGLGLAVLGLVVRLDTPAGNGDVVPWVGLGAAVWLGGLATAALLAAPSASRRGRRTVAALVIAGLVAPLGLSGWWLVRGIDGPLATGDPALVPAYLASRPGDTLLLTGTVDDGVDLRVVAGAGPYLGEESVVASSPVSRRVLAAVRGVLAAPSKADVDTLAAAGIDAIYAPEADADLAARLDAAPSLAPAGGDKPGSRVWTLEVDGVQPAADPRAGVWRWFLGAGQALAWVIALVLTAPVRRREQPAQLIDDDRPASVSSIRRVGA